MNKLRKIWAVRHYNVKSMKKALTFWKLINDSNAKLEMSVQGIYAARLLKTHFRFLATAVNIRRQRESIVTQFHITG